MLSFILAFLLLSSPIAVPGAEESVFSSTFDWKTSPYTGYTRETWVAAAEKIISGVMNRVDPETGIFSFPVPEGAFASYMKPSAEDRIREMERIMVGVVEYYVGTGNDTVPGYDGSITQPFINAYIHGTDPADPLYWGEPQKADQTGSGIVLGLYLAPERFWDPLTSVQKKNLLTYLEKNCINPTWDNNHLLFHLVTTRFLEEHGFDGHRDYHTGKLERLLSWYRGQGWYIDGDNRGFDYYNLWGFQLYMNWILRFDPVWANQYGERMREISSRFMETAPYLYSRASGHIPWGRSLTYRFAADAAIGWNILNGNGDMDPGLARRLMSGDLKYFLDCGAVSGNGLIEIGYRGKNTDLAEHYNSPLDSYFATQAFCVLLLPEDHPFWTAKEKRSPADRKGGRKAVRGGGFVLNVRPDGDARIYFAGQTYDRTHWQASAKYMQEAYSADLGFCVSGGNSAPTGQGMTGWSQFGDDWMYRWRTRTLLLEDDHIASYWHMVPDYRLNRENGTPEFGCYKIYSHTLIGRRGELRVFWHDNPDPVRFRSGGYAIQVPFSGEFSQNGFPGGLELSSGNYRSSIYQVYGPDGAVEAVLQRPSEGWTNTHLFGGLGAWPRWESGSAVPPFSPVVLFVDGSANGRTSVPDVRVRRSSDGLEIVFEDRKYHIEVIDGKPVEVTSLDARKYSVRDYGAKGDGLALDTEAVQSAIDRAASNGGGTVVLPEGTYLCGSIWLRSNIELHLEEGAVIKGSPNIADYCAADCCSQNEASVGSGDYVSGGHLLLGVGVKNVTLSGRGAIDGNSDAFLLDSQGKAYPAKSKIPCRPSQMVWFVDCQDICVKDIELADSPYWSLFILNSERVRIDGCYVHTHRKDYHTFNGDGIDIDRCKNVSISNCRVDTADDCITLRASSAHLLEKPMDCTGISVKDCTLSSNCNAIRIGVGEGHIYDAVFSGIEISDSNVAFNIVAAYSKGGRGTDINDIMFKDIRVEARELMRIHHMRSAGAAIKDITFDGIEGTAPRDSHIWAKQAAPFRNIVFRDVDVPASYECINATVKSEGGLFRIKGLSSEELERRQDSIENESKLLY